VITVGIKEAKNNLSRYLAQVKAGKEVVITEHGKPVARIISEGGKKRNLRTALAPLIGRGLIIQPVRELNKEPEPPLTLPGKALSEMVIEDRR
jgi:prevent-host-death family protein